jgi:hypothetical protein
MSNVTTDQTERLRRAALPAAERQAIIKNLFINHDRFQESIKAVERFHMPVDGGTPDFGVLSAVCGDSRTGKSFTFERYVKRFPLETTATGVVRRVVYADMPVDCTLRAMAEQIGDQLNLPYSGRMNARSLIGAVLSELKRQKVEFLILDEFQEAFDASRRKVLKDARGFLRKILNLRTLNVCVGGLIETYELLAGDSQLKGRGLLPYHLVCPYEWNDKEELTLFRLLCDYLDDGLPFKEKSGLGATSFACRLHYASNGVIGLLKEIVFAAACGAINDGSEKVDISYFAAAWDIRKPIGTVFNPFSNDMNMAPPKITPGGGAGAAARATAPPLAE